MDGSRIYRMLLNLRAGSHAAAVMETILLLALRTGESFQYRPACFGCTN